MEILASYNFGDFTTNLQPTQTSGIEDFCLKPSCRSDMFENQIQTFLMVEKLEVYSR
jgi:hypothetical protein